MTQPSRSLTPLERAILRAVVDLGDDAYGVPVRKRFKEIHHREIGIVALYMRLNQLEQEGFVKAFDVEGDFPERGGRGKRFWRPAFDLTEVLREP